MVCCALGVASVPGVLGVVGVQVLSLTNGSVIVKMRLALSNGSIDTADLMKAINDAISDGDLASIGATGSVAIKG